MSDVWGRVRKLFSAIFSWFVLIFSPQLPKSNFRFLRVLQKKVAPTILFFNLPEEEESALSSAPVPSLRDPSGS